MPKVTQREIRKKVLNVLDKKIQFVMIIPSDNGIEIIRNCNPAFEKDIKFMLKVEDILNT